MTGTKLLWGLAAVALLGACEAKIGDKADEQKAPAETKAREGQFSLKAPGIDMKVDIPSAIAENAVVQGDADIVYPGSKVSGLAIAAEDGKGDKDKGTVDIRFVNDDALETVVAWYRDPARAKDFTIESARRDGDVYVITGAATDGDGRFTLRLGPKEGGGTDGRLTLTDRA